MNTTSKIPRLDAYDIGDGVHWVVWCVDCKRYHYHGRQSGHRWAHCHDTRERHHSEGLYGKTGYILVRRGRASAEIMADIKRRRPRGPAGVKI